MLLLWLLNTWSLLFFLTDGPESAFIYALTSAITVHKISEACYENRFGNYCSPDNSRLGEQSPERWVWGSSHDITKGVEFAQVFLDNRDIAGLSSLVASTKKRSVIHLHNNAVGRRVSIIVYSAIHVSL